MHYVKHFKKIELYEMSKMYKFKDVSDVKILLINFK